MSHHIAAAALAAATLVSIAAPATADQAHVNQHKGTPVILKIDGPRADHRKCVTYGEWGRIDNPARSKKDLATLLDGPGTKQTGNLAGVWYPICDMSSKKGRVILTYNDGATLDIAMWMVFSGPGSGFRTVARISSAG